MADHEEPLSILLVDDDEDDYLIVKRLVSKMNESYFKLEWVGSPERARDIIETSRHDVYLIDYRLGSMTGLQMLEGIDLFMHEQPFIILTGVRDRSVERAATDIGISDYLVKDKLDEELLGRVLRYNVQRKRSEVHRLQQLKEMNAAKDEFIALASHQLRTPATAVKQYLGILLEGYAGELTPQQTDYIQIANDSNDRQLVTINDLLKTAQLDAKRYKLNRVETELTRYVGAILPEFDTILALKGQQYDYDPGNEVSAKIDQHEMKLAIVNLIENAHKYSGDNTTIHVDIQSTDTHVTISVRDEGVGIAPKDQEAIFEKFTRIPNELSDSTSGNGLGLYWVKRIVMLHDGNLSVSSERGAGTTFTIQLPL